MVLPCPLSERAKAWQKVWDQEYRLEWIPTEALRLTPWLGESAEQVALWSASVPHHTV